MRASTTSDESTTTCSISLHSRLRTLDALHLATAVRLKGAISSILTFDKELATAASRNGISAAATR